ncbi:TIGR02679 family protein [Kitasatospora sp. NPDC006697]|uniref:TIGR02679 family protein n=1 Tax=Kitasatospora sp. NPDC006697 TaxID=3364020 RepID=UPI0036865BD9
MTDLPRLRRLLGGPDTAWLVERVRERLATGRALDTPATLKDATAEQRRAVELLLGRRLRSGHSLSVPLTEVDRTLRESLACPDGLAVAVVLLTGPVTDRRAEAAASADAWRDAFVPLDTVCDRAELAAWRARLESTGLLKRLSGADPAAARQLAEQAALVLAQLPADPATALTVPVLAARGLADAHALDEGRPLAALVRSALKALAGLPESATTGAEGRRALWAAVGVAVDDLSSRVLTLGLPGGDRGTTARILAAAREGGEPCVLTLRQLARAGDGGPFTDVGSLVRVCENPTVVSAAAASLGADCPPLICVEGNVSLAARTLLARLSTEGTRLAYHGDFDWGGVRIAAGVMRLPGAVPWRYDRAAYLDALSGGLGTPLTTGVPAPTPWDPQLSSAIERHCIRVEEELLLPHLLADLQP